LHRALHRHQAGGTAARWAPFRAPPDLDHGHRGAEERLHAQHDRVRRHRFAVHQAADQADRGLHHWPLRL